ncbi:hypothetical protein BD626DRAFT_574887 [Schizophyllum amplum]|uniref:Uncharacterized protein n=1 Tax=Schizophyllum amplum TaxID=97359 RepID=A0A550BX23_9AGAR|nr:hypothetical protein BD626DRAFT_574887 [Auriculariopsis ampla]
MSADVIHPSTVLPYDTHSSPATHTCTLERSLLHSQRSQSSLSSPGRSLARRAEGSSTHPPAALKGRPPAALKRQGSPAALKGSSTAALKGRSPAAALKGELTRPPR